MTSTRWQAGEQYAASGQILHGYWHRGDKGAQQWLHTCAHITFSDWTGCVQAPFVSANVMAAVRVDLALERAPSLFSNCPSSWHGLETIAPWGAVQLVKKICCLR